MAGLDEAGRLAAAGALEPGLLDVMAGGGGCSSSYMTMLGVEGRISITSAESLCEAPLKDLKIQVLGQEAKEGLNF